MQLLRIYLSVKGSRGRLERRLRTPYQTNRSLLPLISGACSARPHAVYLAAPSVLCFGRKVQAEGCKRRGESPAAGTLAFLPVQ